VPNLTIDKYALTQARWSKPTTSPGDTVNLMVEGNVKGDQKVCFYLRHGEEVIDKVEGAPGAASAAWKPLNIAGEAELTFQAVLRENPSPANGHRAIVTTADSTGEKSGKLTLRGFQASVTTLDPYFVPHAERLSAKYVIVDPSKAATAGRIEVWGDRYPTCEPLYVEDFSPVSGRHDWQWDGKANRGALNGKYISPEFSPYRLRIVIGLTKPAVEKPFEAGLGKVAIVEAAFEVAFQSIAIRLQSDLELPDIAPSVRDQWAEMFAIEPRAGQGTYAVMGRLPLETEPEVVTGALLWKKREPARPGVARLRIPCLRTRIADEALNQATSGAPAQEHHIADLYMSADGTGNAGRTKYSLDGEIYSRPEIPIEFVPYLHSKNTSGEARKRGVADQDAVGPAVFDVWCDDVYLKDQYQLQAGAYSPHTYFWRSASRVKRGDHQHPFAGPPAPQFLYWQWRVEYAGGDQALDATRTIGPTELPFDPAKPAELTVYLNRTLLTLDEDYSIPPMGTVDRDKKILLAKGVARAGDVIWIFRQDATAAGGDIVARWAAFPPGDNCHEHYGGIRGVAPTGDFVGSLRKAYSAAPAVPTEAAWRVKQPILGRSTSGNFPYTDRIDLDPDGVAAAQRERVRAQALLADSGQPAYKYRGMAGIVFSPSSIAGDSYCIETGLRRCPYARDYGFVQGRPAEPLALIELPRQRTGTMTVWRLCTIEAWRGPTIDDPKLKNRAHPGDGWRMMVSELNTIYQLAFTEWRLATLERTTGAPPVAQLPKVVPVPDGSDPQNTVTKDIYKKMFNAGKAGGFYDVKNVDERLVRWDYYRVKLPPGTPNPRGPKIAKDMIGKDPLEVARRILDPHVATPGGPAPAAPLVSGDPVNTYKGWLDGQMAARVNEALDVFIPQIASTRHIGVLRWPFTYYDQAWVDGAGLGAMSGGDWTGTLGCSRGTGQMYFFCGRPDKLMANERTFGHELAHNLHLVHFMIGNAANRAWKHHDHGNPDCIMGYYGPPTVVDYDVPDTVPALHLRHALLREKFCAKCLLKVRGWDEVVLPCNWDETRVF
jgi:hypothetical protein